MYLLSMKLHIPDPYYSLWVALQVYDESGYIPWAYADHIAWATEAVGF